jgi:cytochrome b subunit of formate dehydrogenase
LKTRAGDITVANCASCHGVHLILPSSDPKSKVHPENLENTCGECHPGISAELAAVPIHGVVAAREEPNKVAEIVKVVYIVAIIGIVGFMLLYCFIDLMRQAIAVMKKPQVRRMRRDEVWQHVLLMVSFIVLVITGFALRYGDKGMTRYLFGWDHGFEVRGIIHRVAAVVLIISTVWHVFYLLTHRGKRFFRDMLPTISDFKQFFQKMLFNLGLSKTEPKFGRFSYVEKVEYFALIWGNVVMILTGILLWFDNFFIGLLPKGFLDVALVIHFYEAILATLAILIWHLYATVFNPHVYPMNPSWLTGNMPRDMFAHEHADVEPEEIEEKS